MDDRPVTESLKKILMAGFGAVSTGMEKSQEVLDKLAEKGEGAYQQAVAAGKETAEKLMKAYEESGIKALFDKGLTFRKEDLCEIAETLPVEDLIWLQNQLAAIAVKKAASKGGDADACDCAAEETKKESDTDAE